MPHDENELRDKTAEILDAYIELTGYSGGISIDDFLHIRKEAEEELKYNIRPHTGRISKRQTEKSAGIDRQAPVAPVKKTVPEAPKTPAAAVEPEKPKHPAFQVVDTSEEPEESTTEPDDYEILRQMEDPWN